MARVLGQQASRSILERSFRKEMAENKCTLSLRQPNLPVQQVMKKTPAEFRSQIDLERYLRFNIQWRFREVMVREIAAACKSMPTALLELVICYI